MREHRLWTGGTRVVVGVSGGADSTALLGALLELPPAWRPEVVAAHLDHGLRPDSGREAEAVVALARGLGVRCSVGRADVAAEARRGHLSVEDAARRARYRFLAEVAAAEGAPVVAVGHQRDDQVETVLLRLLRGAGARGLAGMRPSRRLAGPGGEPLRLVRPLWFAWRSDVLAYLAARGLSWIEDPSNDDPAIPRNRLRREVLPAVERVLGPGARAAIWRSATNLREEHAALCRWAAVALAKHAHDGGLRLDRGLRRLPPAVRQRVVQAWWERWSGLPPLPRSAVRGLLSLPEGGRADLPGGWRATRLGGVLRLGEADAGSGAEGPFALPVPGSADIPGVGRITAEVAAWPGPAPPDRPTSRRMVAVGDLRGVQLPLAVRAPRPGERLRPLGAAGARPVRELLRAAGVDPAGRRACRVVVDARGRVLWLAGVRPAADFRVGDGTRCVLVLTLRPAPGDAGGHPSGSLS